MIVTEQPPRRPMYMVGTKKNSYSSDHDLPLTLVDDQTTAESLKALLEATGATKAYVQEVPIWPAMRKEEE